MAIETTYNEEEVIDTIEKALETFYGALIEKIEKINGPDIVKIMKGMNPYLYRAKAINNAAEIVENVMNAFVASNEEAVFGNSFFQPLAIAASGGNKALAEGIDIMAQQAKPRYEGYIGDAYGKKKESDCEKPQIYQELSGKEFWAELTGDEDFYLKIIQFMGKLPEQYAAAYKERYNKASNRLVREFSNQFCTEDGSIDWEKLVKFHSED